MDGPGLSCGTCSTAVEIVDAVQLDDATWLAYLVVGCRHLRWLGSTHVVEVLPMPACGHLPTPQGRCGALTLTGWPCRRAARGHGQGPDRCALHWYAKAPQASRQEEK